MRAAIAGVFAFVATTPLVATPAQAEHTPLIGLRWQNIDADADFNLGLVWAQGFSNTQWRDRVLDVVAQDPSCYANSCSPANVRPGSYARWYLDRAHPYFGTTPTTITTAFNPILCSGTGYPTADLMGNVSFSVVPLNTPAVNKLCGTADRILWSNIGVDDTPMFTQATGQPPGACPWWEFGPADQDNATPDGRCDLMSTITHEVGHAMGLLHYIEVNGTSVDPVCLDGQAPSKDPKTLYDQGDNSRRETMCVPPYDGTEHWRTPGPHEKEAFRKLHPPTGPAPTIHPAHTVTSTKATYEVTVPKDPDKATSFYMIFGDGTYETRAIPQGSGTEPFIFRDHEFNGGAGTYTQEARIVETGASAQATTATRCAASMPSCFLADFEPSSVPAGATAITFAGCGQVLSSRNTTYALATDIGPCDVHNAWGVKIAADGITLDLNGHEIIGCSSPAGTEGDHSPPARGSCDDPVPVPPFAGAYTVGEGTGVYLEDVQGVTVTNSKATWSPATGTDTPGTLTGYTSHVAFFDQGVAVTNRGAACRDVAVAAVAGPPAVPAHTKPNCDNTIEKLNVDKSIGTQVSHVGEGIVLHESGGNTVRNNVVDHSGPYAGIGVYDNPTTPCDTGPTNFTVGLCSRGNKIKNNTVLDTNTITYEEAFIATGIRINPAASYTLVENNTVDNSSFNGIALLPDSHHNIVFANTVTDNGFHHGSSSKNREARLSDPLHGDGSGDFVRNLDQVFGDGIKVFAGSSNNTINNNVVCGNAGSGIHLQGSSGTHPGASNNTVRDNESGGSWYGDGEVAGSDGGPGDDGTCGTVGATKATDRVENLCDEFSGHASTGGGSPPPPCSKNNVGKDPNPNPGNGTGRNYDLKDGNPACGTNTWRGNSHGRNSWAAPAPRYDDRYHPQGPGSCAVTW